MKKIYKNIILIIIFTVLLAAINTKVHAAGIGMSINKSLVYVGDTFSVTISGINGKVAISGNSNISLSTSGTKWVEGSMTITGTAKSVGSGTITVKPIDVSTTGADPQEVTTSASKSITIKQKETTTQTPAEPKAPTNNTTTTNKPSTNTKPATTTKTETKPEVKKEDNFYIANIVLKGIKENGEQTDISLSPIFNKDTYEYTCNIASDIQKIDLQKDAGEYTNSVIVTGLDDLKEGENIIKLVLSAEDHESKTYIVKVIKEKQEIVETIANIEEDKQEIKVPQEEKKEIMVSMPLYIFIVMQVLIIIIEVLIIYFVPWRNLFKIKNKNIDIDE